MTPRRDVLIFVMLLLFPSGTVFPAGPVLEVSVGFDNLFRQDTLSSLGVLLRSPDSPLEGELIVEYDAGTALERTGHIRFSRPVSLPADVSGVYRFTLPLKAGTYPLTVRVERNGILVVRTELELRPMLARGPIVVGLSRKPSLDALISPLAGLSGERLEFRYPRVEYLPLDPRGWDGANLVLWHDLSPDAPDPEAGRALAAWVSSGGLLAVFEGPWNVNGMLPPAFGTVAVPDGGGSVPFGLGRILFLPPELSAAGSRQAGTVVTALASAGLFGSSSDLHSAVDAEVRRIRRAAFAAEEAVAGSPGRLLLLLSAYVLIAAGILIVGMKMRTGRWLQPAALLMAAVVCSAVVFLMPESRHDDPRIERLNLVVAPGPGPVIHREELLFYSPRGSDSRLILRDGQLPIPTAGSSLRIDIGPDGPVLEKISVEPWQPMELSLERIRFEPDESDGPAGPSYPGGSSWKDVVIVAEGEMRYLAGEWDGAPDLPEEGAPYRGEGSAAYRAFLRRLAVLPGGEPVIIARGETGPDGVLSLLVLPGGFR